MVTPAWSASEIPPKDAWQVSVSSIQSEEYQAAYLADGDLKTRWSSQPEDEEWVLIDLGKVVEITGFTLHWEHAYASKYSLLVSPEGRDWTTVYINNDGDGNMDDVYIRPVAGRYVRLETRARATGWGYSLWEFDIKGPNDLVKITDVSGGGETTQFLMDGRRETVWKSGPVDRAELLLDLRKPRNISGVRIDWDEQYAGSVEMAISLDGNEWKPAASHFRLGSSRKNRFCSA